MPLLFEQIPLNACANTVLMYTSLAVIAISSTGAAREKTILAMACVV